MGGAAAGGAPGDEALMSVRKSLGYAYTAQALNFIIAFATSVIVARLVSPREFGMFAMASAASAILNLFFSFSLASYIIREPEVDTPLLRSAFSVNAVLTGVLALLIYAAGWIAILLLDSPEVGRMMRLFAIVPLISMFEFIPSAICSREMRFKLTSAIGVIRLTALSCTTILLAWAGFHEMAFVWAAICAAIVSVSLFNVRVWRPDVWQPRSTDFRKITSFGLQMMSINGLSQLSSRAGDLVLGSLLGLRMLGLYNRAAGLSGQVYNSVYGIGTSVVFAKLSLEFRETGSFHDSFLKAVSVMLAVVWPMMIGMAILSRPVISILYGPEWQDAAGPLSLLMMALFIVLGVGMNWEVFVLRKETRLQAKIELTRSTAGFLMFVAGAMINLTAAATAKVLESALAFALYRRHMDRLVGAGPGELRGVYVINLKLTSVAVSPAFALMLWRGWSPSTPLIEIAVAVCLGILAWTALLFTLKHPLSTELRRFYVSRTS